jgi:xanthine dehydrogenase accessory factor
MIGSKGKVQKNFDNLRKNGVSEEQIETIHAPIGLKIGAVTPAEIAVSILAEIIQEKNQKQKSSVSRELLEGKEKGVLCIIIEKTGSSPRGVGSMLFVGESGVIDSIGGGAVEYAAIRQAQAVTEPMIREYDLSEKDKVELGMICGGRNTVLFIPIEGEKA